MATFLVQRVCPDFIPGGAFAVGAEEELFLLDSSGDLDPRSGGPLVDAVRQAMAGTAGTVSSELFAAQIEFATGICADAGAIASELGDFRDALRRTGANALAAGLHPTAPFGDAVLSTQPRHQAIGEGFAGLLRTPTAAFQVHVGLPDERAALLAYRGMRHRLAVVQALASSSPYWHGRDSGMASGRWAVINSYPRGGTPPILHTWEEYAALVEQVAGAANVAEHTQIWWDARLQPRLGTLE
ncbi:MAG: glutamate-cysteine ligase family protein, partial [Marmoricola sp.]